MFGLTLVYFYAGKFHPTFLLTPFVTFNQIFKHSLTYARRALAIHVHLNPDKGLMNSSFPYASSHFTNVNRRIEKFSLEVRTQKWNIQWKYMKPKCKKFKNTSYPPIKDGRYMESQRNIRKEKNKLNYVVYCNI